MSDRDLPEIWRVSGPISLPQPPESMSFTTLEQIEACPREWALSNASYPRIWAHPGYPRRINNPAIRGRIIHQSISLILQSLSSAGCSSVRDPKASVALKSIGGYSNILDRCATQIIQENYDNPRAQYSLPYCSRVIKSRLDEMRADIQIMVSKVALYPTHKTQEGNALRAKSLRKPLIPGSHPEVKLQSHKLGWIGIADLINIEDIFCEISEFKTGHPRQEDSTQLRIYSLLWFLDKEINPTSRKADKLTLHYAKSIVNIEPPSEDELYTMEVDLRQRTHEALGSTKVSPPRASLDEKRCCYCNVRQICEDYWLSEVGMLTGDESPKARARVDLEAIVTGMHGPTSWELDIQASKHLPSGQKVILTTNPANRSIGRNELIRVIDGYLETCEPTFAIVNVDSSSEIFFVR